MPSARGLGWMRTGRLTPSVSVRVRERDRRPGLRLLLRCAAPETGEEFLDHLRPGPLRRVLGVLSDEVGCQGKDDPFDRLAPGRAFGRGDRRPHRAAPWLDRAH